MTPKIYVDSSKEFQKSNYNKDNSEMKTEGRMT